MRTINLLALGVALGIILCSAILSRNTPDIDLDNMELDNTTEDMIEWINSDYDNGYINEMARDSYLANLEEIIRLNNDQK